MGAPPVAPPAAIPVLAQFAVLRGTQALEASLTSIGQTTPSGLPGQASQPLDRFAAELMLMQGSDEQGGTEGFAIASGNALPMAMKGHVVAQAFLGIDMKCARCHDGPNVPFAQSDLFGLAAMLDEKSVTVDLASTVVVPPSPNQSRNSGA